MLKKSLLVGAVVAATALSANAQSLEERVEALEFADYENWWKFSGNLEYRFDAVETEYKKAYNTLTFDGSTNSYAKGDKNSVKHHRIFSELDIEAKPSDKLTFYGRLSASKAMNTLNKGGGTYVQDSAFNELGEGMNGGNSSVFLERAFVNYSLMKNLVLSVGRLPTVEGTPAHFSEARSPMGGYPLLAFGGVFDGIALTYGHKLGGGDLTLRGIYTPFNTRNIDFGNEKFEDANGMEVDENVDVYSLMVEFQKTNFSWVKNFHFTYQYLKFGRFNALAKAHVVTTNPSSNAVVSSKFDGNIELGLERHVLNLDLVGIAKTGLNFGVSFLKGKAEGSGNLTQTSYDNDGGTAGPTSIGTWLGSSAKEHDGDAWIFNLSYNIMKLRNATVGVEYVTIDDDAFVYDSASKNLVGQYTARGGDAKHFYWVQPIDNNFKVKFGYQEANRKKTNYLGGLIGSTSDVDNVTKSYYSSLQFTF